MLEMNYTFEDYIWEREVLTRFTALIKSIYTSQHSVDYEEEYKRLRNLRDKRVKKNGPSAKIIYYTYLNLHIKELHEILSYELIENFRKNSYFVIYRVLDCIKYADSIDGQYVEESNNVLSSIIFDSTASPLFMDFSIYGNNSSLLINEEFMNTIGQEVADMLPKLENSLIKPSSGFCKDIRCLPPDIIKQAEIIMWYYAVYDDSIDGSLFNRACSLYEVFTTSEAYIYSKRKIIRLLNVGEIIARELHDKITNASSVDIIGWVDSVIEFYRERNEEEMLRNELETLLSSLCWMGSYKAEKEVLEFITSRNVFVSNAIITRQRFLNESPSVKDRAWDRSLLLKDNPANEKESGHQETIVYDYKLLSMSEMQINQYYMSLTAENRVEINKTVVFEWVNNLNIKKGIKFDINRFKDTLGEILIEEIGETISCAVVETAISGEEHLDNDIAIYVSEAEADGRYPWIGFIITFDRITRKQMAVSVYTIYDPEKDSLPLDGIVEQNRFIQQRYINLKNNRNPKVKNYIYTMQSIIVEEMEKYLNSEIESDSIY